MMAQTSKAKVDPVTLTVTANFLTTVSREMGEAVRKTAYSPIFNEALDFSCAVFDEQGEMIGQGDFCPAMLGSVPLTMKMLVESEGLDAFGEGDIYLHNDPFSGMNHLPEHMVVKAIFHEGERVGMVLCLGHMAEVGGLAPGGFPGDAREVFHEGLRIPPLKIVKNGVDNEDVWKMIKANNRTPRVSEGDIRAMMGALTVGERRFLEIVERLGRDRFREVKDEIKAYSERRMRAAISDIPDGDYIAEEYIIDNDGWLDEPVKVKVNMRVRGDSVVADFTGSDPQRDGSCNLTLATTTSAVYNAMMYVTDSDIPANEGRYRPVEVVAPPGTVTNAVYPASTVGGNSEVHPRVVSLIWKALSQAVPEKTAASCSETAMLVTFGGVHPATGDFFSSLMIEGQGWGGRHGSDGWDVVTLQSANCVVCPIEVLETRFPLRNHSFGINEGSGGAGEFRGGHGGIRVMELESDMTVSCYHSSERLVPWGLFGGGDGTLSAFLVKTPGDEEFKNFKERFGVRCAGKFTNIKLPKGTLLKLVVGGAGGYGDPDKRSVESIANDLFHGFESEESLAKKYPKQIGEAKRIRDEYVRQLQSSQV